MKSAFSVQPTSLSVATAPPQMLLPAVARPRLDPHGGKALGLQKADKATAEQRLQAADAALQKRIGQLVGSVFYTTLIKEMQKSTLRTPLMHGGRGEEAFEGQWALELGETIGAARNDPVAKHLYRAARRRLGRELLADAPGQGDQR